ncbi:MAG: beta-ketoacyl-ACP synthase 3 [Planctomycetaceae bacterium]|nr:beta-ketoacyl-ACP synthase 3 [Planctomycetaceae bacterium]
MKSKLPDGFTSATLDDGPLPDSNICRTLWLGWGHAFGDRVVTNDELEHRFGLAPGWIEQRTGFRARRYATREIATSDLATAAAAQAIERSGLSIHDIGFVLLATSTPDHLLPGTAPTVAARLGSKAPAFDLMAACTGFVYGLMTADHLVRSSRRPVLLIGANILSRRVNPADSATATLFGDAAGAVVLGPSALDANAPSPGGLTSPDLALRNGADTRETSCQSDRIRRQPESSSPLDSHGLLATTGQSAGEHASQLFIPTGGSRNPWHPAQQEAERFMQMPSGQTVFKLAVNSMLADCRTVLTETKIEPHEVDWLIAHQASQRIVTELGRRLTIPENRVAWWLSEYGNSSSATIPVALSIGREQGLIQVGQTLLLAAAGAGFCSAASILRA